MLWTDTVTQVVIGWSMKPTLARELVLDALLMALWRRKPTQRVLVHSDQGTQCGSADRGSTRDVRFGRTTLRLSPALTRVYSVQCIRARESLRVQHRRTGVTPPRHAKTTLQADTTQSVTADVRSARHLRSARGGPRMVITPGSTVLVVDDDSSVREALIGLLRSAGLRVVAFASAKEFLRQPRLEFPACLVLDVRLPDMDGFDVQRGLLESGGEMPVIYITGHGDIPMSVRAIRAGAIDFLTKPFGDEELLTAIRRALAVHEAACAQSRYAVEIRRRFATLTRREHDVMELVVRGLLNKQIAAALGTAEITIKVHRRRVMQKMLAASLPDLVRMSVELGRPHAQA